MMRFEKFLKTGVIALFLAIMSAALGHAQTSSSPAIGKELIGPPVAPILPVAPSPAPAPPVAAEKGPDYAAWDKLAKRAEAALADKTTSNNGFNLLRGQLADWRGNLQSAQNINSSRIQTLRNQITALGPVPAEGQSEAPAIAARRTELQEQLTRLQAPSLAAEEAYRRADGLISEIDRILRERQASELLTLWPSPLKPSHWVEAFGAVKTIFAHMRDEVMGNWKLADRRTEMINSLPVIGVLLFLAIMLIWRARAFIDRAVFRLQQSAKSGRVRRLWAFFASFGQIIIPFAGVVFISWALARTAMPGFWGKEFLRCLPKMGFIIFAAHWLGGQVFPKADAPNGPLALQPDECAEGRFYSRLIGVVLAFEQLRLTLLPPAQQPVNAVAVLALPLIVLMGLMLWRMGHLLMRHSAHEQQEDTARIGDRIIGIIAKMTLAIALIGPLLAVIGYASAAAALVFPMAVSLGLLGLLVVLLHLMNELYAMFAARGPADGEDAGGGLLPVLASFTLSMISLPLFALIWGARGADLWELWTRFTQGFSIGNTHISPISFLYFAIVFSIGFGLTRLFQGALRGTILPKTRLDQGGRNAIVIGTGYMGIFLSAVIAISSAGIDLSGLAILASALSVGIGFGLQNIVSNFVSGIILLIERPVSEGDWIEVGTVSGTVKTISVRSTRIQTFDRADVIVPNSDLVTQRVTNWTRYNLSGRVIVPVSVDLHNDTRKVTQILQEIAEAQPMVILNPPPTVAFTGFTAEALNFEVRMILRDVNFSLAVKTEVNHQIIQRFREEGIAFPVSYAKTSGKI